ncbi:hypothetical protein EDB19DRAFT_1830965 [Suillus lakei]|nr:hypothetical protein EDB19DRAFT_1830965 [Suillus lakei]
MPCSAPHQCGVINLNVSRHNPYQELDKKDTPPNVLALTLVDFCFSSLLPSLLSGPGSDVFSCQAIALGWSPLESPSTRENFFTCISHLLLILTYGHRLPHSSPYPYAQPVQIQGSGILELAGSQHVSKLMNQSDEGPQLSNPCEMALLPKPIIIFSYKYLAIMDTSPPHLLSGRVNNTILWHLSSKQPTAVSGDILLPLLIFTVVKSNPARLVSHLLFTQRYRNAVFTGGEERYCLINLMAVVEFLENVDLGALFDPSIFTTDLTPIPIVRTTLPPDAPTDAPGSVEQGVDAIAGSANKPQTRSAMHHVGCGGCC